MSTSRLTLIQNIGNELGRGSGTCSAAGTTTTIVDTSGDSPLDTGDATNLYKNAWAMIEADSAGTPLNVSEVRRVSDYAPGTATITVSRAFSNATTVTQSYGCYFVVPPTRLGVNKGIADYINDTLRNLYYRDYYLLTLVTDGDMETSGVSNWTAANATVAKTTTSGQYWGGKQGISVAATAANGYARSALLDVTEGQSYMCMALVKSATTGVAKLQLYDETNGAEIESDEGGERSWRYLSFHDTIPDGCRQVSVRLITETDATTVYWDNVTLLNMQSTVIDLPSWLLNEQAVYEVYLLSGGSEEPDRDSLAIDERATETLPWFEVIGGPTQGVPWRLEFWPHPVNGYQMVAGVIRKYGELSSETDTTDADAELVKAGALYRIAADFPEHVDIQKWAAYYRSLLARYAPRVSRRLRVRPY